MRLLATFCIVSVALPMAAQTTALNRQQLLDLARRRAPIALSSSARIAEARSRLVGASVLLRDNPVIDSEIGRRETADGRNLQELDLGVSQSVELGGKRSARIAEARAGVDRESAVVSNSLRQLLRDVSVAYFQTIAAQKRVGIAIAGKQVADDLHRISERRFQAGDIAQLELNLARNSAARASAELRAAEADELAAYATIRSLLGLRPDELLAIEGTLEQPAAPADYFALIESRPDIRALEAERGEAEAIGRLGSSLRVPDISLGVRQKREEGANATVGTVGVTLPVFNRGQEQTALATARRNRVDIELNALRNVIRNEIVSAIEVSRRKSDAVAELTRGALPQLDENERLTIRSYEEGEIGLAELLLIRRETLETRREYITRALDASLALVDLEFVSGVLQ